MSGARVKGLLMGRYSLQETIFLTFRPNLKKWSNLEEIKSWLSFFKINEAEKINVTLKSTHKPVVLNDFAVISITYSLQKSNQHDKKEYLQMFEQLKAENAEMKTKINLLHIHKVETESKMKILQGDNSKVSSQVDSTQQSGLRWGRRWSAASWSATIAPAAEDLGQVCACHDQRSRYKSQHKAKLFSHKLQ